MKAIYRKRLRSPSKKPTRGLEGLQISLVTVGSMFNNSLTYKQSQQHFKTNTQPLKNTATLVKQKAPPFKQMDIGFKTVHLKLVNLRSLPISLGCKMGKFPTTIKVLRICIRVKI